MAKKKITQPTAVPAEQVLGVDMATKPDETVVAGLQEAPAYSPCLSPSEGLTTPQETRKETSIELLARVLTAINVPYTIRDNAVWKDAGIGMAICFSSDFGKVIVIDHETNIEQSRYSYLNFDTAGNFKRNT